MTLVLLAYKVITCSVLSAWMCVQVEPMLTLQQNANLAQLDVHCAVDLIPRPSAHNALVAISASIMVVIQRVPLVTMVINQLILVKVRKSLS